MIKIITLITKFILVLLTALLFASCNYNLNLKSQSQAVVMLLQRTEP
jgi:hypothetical protein